MKRSLAILLAVVLLVSMLPAASLAASQYATVVGGWLRLRSGASYDSDTITSYYTGTQVKILGQSGSWYRVQTSDGRTGYMHSDYLKLSGTSSGSTYTAYVISHNGYGVRLRTGPGTGYRIIATYAVGTPLTVLQSGKYWSKITIGGNTGYMMSEFISNGSSSGTETAVGYATIWSRNGYGVRLRTGPGTEYDKIGTYAVGTAVTILKKGDVWDRVRVGSRVGYMMNEFLRYHGTNEVTSVTLNNLSPVVGDVLRVQAISPANATVRYEWLVGNDVYTTSTYTVSSADVGKTIQLRVTGTGSYFGSAKSAVTKTVISNTVVYDVKLNTTAPMVGTVLKMASVSPSGAKVSYQWSAGGNLLGTGETYTVQTGDVGRVIRLTVIGRDGYTGSDYAETAAVAARTTLTGASLSKTTAAVGDTLTYTASPSGATVTAQWLRDGEAISGATGESYTLTAEDYGKTISVRLTGVNACEGTVTSAATQKIQAAETIPVINNVVIPEATVNTSASTVQFTAQGGGTITWKLIGGALPGGMELSSGGTLSGLPTSAGTFAFTVSASNAAGTGTKDFELVVKEASVPTTEPTPTASPDPTVEPTPTTYTLTVDGGSGTISGLAANAQVSIMANTVEGKAFAKWELTAGDGNFENSNSAATTFYMKGTNATVKATYVDNTVAETKFTLTVEDGTGGSSELAWNGTADITANPPAENMVFANWTLVSGSGHFTDSTKSTTTFHMNGENATVKANYQAKSEAEQTYSLTVDGGKGGASGLHAGDVVSITADAAANGKIFIGWTRESGEGNFADSTQSNTTFTMGSSDATVKANYAENTTYTLTVVGGTASQTENLKPNTTVDITAKKKDGFTFLKWELTSGQGNFNNSNSANTTFKMGESDATITATYRKEPVKLATPTVTWNGAQDISWTAVAGAVEYEIQCNRKDGTKGEILRVKDLSFHSGIVAQTGDIFYVTAIGDDENYTDSDTGSATYTAPSSETGTPSEGGTASGDGTPPEGGTTSGDGAPSDDGTPSEP